MFPGKKIDPFAATLLLSVITIVALLFVVPKHSKLFEVQNHTKGCSFFKYSRTLLLGWYWIRLVSYLCPPFLHDGSGQFRLSMPPIEILDKNARNT